MKESRGEGEMKRKEGEDIRENNKGVEGRVMKEEEDKMTEEERRRKWNRKERGKGKQGNKNKK